ncbi:hypothetical protein Micbo1qcDRAFT_207280 [Microdochium bolleyi]|uniref:Transmembrane protein n=1 Tax=Microdochium bolleyi TaxID=196109 RepID=A0A136IU36_9PEZI|nr:hypothetical protein Micbo1qcDRAFT_207280 [Microdochium bolleyi]
MYPQHPQAGTIYDGTHSQAEVDAYIAHVYDWTRGYAYLAAALAGALLVSSAFFGWHFLYKKGNDVSVVVSSSTTTTTTTTTTNDSAAGDRHGDSDGGKPKLHRESRRVVRTTVVQQKHHNADGGAEENSDGEVELRSWLTPQVPSELSTFSSSLFLPLRSKKKKKEQEQEPGRCADGGDERGCEDDEGKFESDHLRFTTDLEQGTPFAAEYTSTSSLQPQSRRPGVAPARHGLGISTTHLHPEWESTNGPDRPTFNPRIAAAAAATAQKDRRGKRRDTLESERTLISSPQDHAALLPPPNRGSHERVAKEPGRQQDSLPWFQPRAEHHGAATTTMTTMAGAAPAAGRPEPEPANRHGRLGDKNPYNTRHHDDDDDDDDDALSPHALLPQYHQRPRRRPPPSPYYDGHHHQCRRGGGGASRGDDEQGIQDMQLRHDQGRQAQDGSDIPRRLH